MEVLGILRSVAIRFVRLDSPPSLFITDLVDELRSRYRFFEVPDRVADVDPSKGVKFALGRFEDSVIDKFEIYDTGIVVEGTVETEVLDRLLDDALAWSVERFGVTCAPSEPVARAYFSGFEVKPSSDLSRLLGLFDSVQAMLTSMVEEQGFAITPYALQGLNFHTDVEKAEPLKPGRFVFERRINRPIEDNVFFSEAPVSTVSHRRLLEILDDSL